MRLVTSSPTRVARLFMSNAAAQSALPAQGQQHRALNAPKSLENKISSHAVEEEAGTIPAVHAAPLEGSAAPVEEVKEKQSKARSLMFRPMKRAAKMAIGKKQALVEVEMPLELSSSYEGPTSNALVAM